MVIVDAGGRVLAFERSDVPNAFQLPQGGLEPGEEPIDALWRELREETGLAATHLAVRAEVPEWLGYELPVDARSPKVGRGQVHKWFILGPRHELPIALGRGPGAEFKSWRWLGFDDLVDQVVAFRQPVYRRLAEFVRGLDPGQSVEV
jgi:putative (di)nucleoside polyphosphate hydrolase